MALKIKKPAGAAALAAAPANDTPATATAGTQALAHVGVTHSDQGKVVSEQHEQEPAGEPKTFDMPPCEVGYAMSYTHNLGNYQSVRGEVSLKMPCLHSEIEEAADFCKEWVEGRLGALVSEMQDMGGEG